jgi:hypothetical protein
MDTINIRGRDVAVTWHAMRRADHRGITAAMMADAVAHGVRKPGDKPNSWRYTKAGVTVVIAQTDGIPVVITTWSDANTYAVRTAA